MQSDPWSDLLDREKQLRFRLDEIKEHQSCSALRKNLETAPDSVSTSVKIWRTFQEDYDQWMLDKINYFNLRAIDFNIKRLEEMKSSPDFSSSQIQSLYASLHNLQEAQKHYLSTLTLFGGDLDHQRIEAGKKIVSLARKLALEIQAAIAKSSVVTTDPSPDIFKNGIKVFKVQKALLGIFFRAFFSPNSAPGETPNLDATFEMYEHFAKEENVTVSCIGNRSLNLQEQDGKTITLVLHNHAHGIFDYSVMASRKRGGIGSIGNLDHILGPWLAEKVGRVNDIVLVGRDNAGTLSKISRLCREKILSAWLVSAEAYTTAGFWDSRPLRKNLEEVFLGPLRESGFKIRIVVWTLPDTYRFLNLWKSPVNPFPPVLRMIVSDPLEDSECQKLHSVGGDPDALLYFVRQNWFENLKTDDKFFLSAPTLNEQREIFDSYIMGL